MRTRTLAAAFAVALFAMPALAAITGTVMTTDGAPVAGARVSIFLPELPEARRARMLSPAPVATPAESTQTDGKGSFSLPSPKDPVVNLRVEAAGYEPIARRVERDEDAGAIALTRREMRKGTITAGGKPVANATVVISYGAEVTTRTDEQGRYEAPELKRARSITVIHPDFAIDEESFASSSGTPASEMNRALAAGTRLAGRVVAADGRTPVANATILVDQWPLATSGDDGTFTIAHAPARWTTLSARKDSLHAQRAFDATKTSLTLKMEKPAMVSGRVTDSKTKLPVAGALVALGSPRRMMIGESADLVAFTDAKGVYSIAAPAGTYAVSASHPAFDIGTAEASVTAGQHAVRDLAIGQLARVSGVVVDDQQRPVVAAVISTESAGSGNPMRTIMRPIRSGVRTLTGPDGRFSIRVSPEQDLRLRATKKGLPQSKEEAINLAPAERKTGVVLLLPTGIAVTGIVKDTNGDPLSGVAVTAMETPSGRGGMVMRQVVMMGFPGEEEDAVRTARDGTFTLRLQEGTYDFTFRREGFAQKAVRAQSVTAQGAQQIETTLEPAVEIAGRVTRGGVGIPDVNLNTFGMGDGGSAVTGPDGSFVLGGLSPGSTRLLIRKEDDFIQDQRTVTAPARDVVFEFPAGGRVSGRVVEKGSSKPITDFQAGISTSRGGGGFMMMSPPQLKSFTTDDGSFVLENVPAGAMNIVAQAPGYAGSRVNVDVKEGETTSDVVIELETGVRLVGRVTGPNGAALSDASVQITPSPTSQFARGGSMRRATTDANGEFTIDSLEPGEETFSVSHPKFVDATKTVTLKGRETRMDVQLSGGQTVKGLVVTDSGMPAADAEVLAFTAAGMSSDRTRTNASGAFEFTTLTPARYTFSANKTGYVQGVVEDVDVSSGGTVRIELHTGGTIYGRVTGLSEQDLAGASVTARSGRLTSSAAVDPQGNFRVEGAPTGTVQVSASTMTRGFMERRSSGTQTVELAAGGSQQVTLEFRTDTIVRGRITRNGTPLGGATVMFQPRGTSRASASTAADEAGNYNVTGLEEGEYNVMVADSQRFNPYQTTYQVRSGASTFDIDYKSASVRGRVIDAGTNEPIIDATVNFRPSSSESRFARAAITDPNGNFTMDSVTPGAYVITASRDGYGAEVRDESFGDSGRDGLEFRLSRNEGVTLHVVDGRDGRQITAFVTVYDGGGRVVYDSRTATFMASGAVADLQLPIGPGSYTASLTMSGYAPTTARLTSPGKQTVTMTPGGSIAVQSKHSVVRRMRILDASGVPYPRTVWTPPARDLLPGTMPIDNVAPGTYTLQLLNDDSSVADSQQVVVREGETTRVTL